MKHIPRLLFIVCLGLTTAFASARAAAISRDGWSYDRADFNENAAQVAAARAAGKGLKLAGWVEYDVTIPATGWYELWLGGCPPEWTRDVSVDGETITRLQVSTGTDKLAKATANGIQFKELNLFLTAGRHALRIQRLSPPGILPSVWELRPSGDAPDGSIRFTDTDGRIGAPGSFVQVIVSGGGTGRAAAYDLFWRNDATDENLPAGRVEIPAGAKVVEQSLTLTLPAAGLYSLQAKIGDEWLRPSDIKAGYFLSAISKGKPAPAAVAQPFQFAGPFRDGVVLQREKPLPVWGWSKPGDRVTVTLADQTEKTVADANGRWQVTFKPLQSGGGALELQAKTGASTLVCKDVLIGEVWLLSGQSNMGGPLWTSTGGPAAAITANFPKVRLAVTREGEPLAGGARRVGPMGWGRAVAGENAQKSFAGWNAIPFAFGTEISEALDVPVGLISANRGGTYISTWISRELHETTPSLRVISDVYRDDERERVPELLHLIKLSGQIRKWRSERDKALAAGRPAPTAPVLSGDIQTSNAPGLNYANLIEPLGAFAVRGVLWYQGESDSSMAEAYAERFPLMIESWRKLWGEPALPFLYAQIAYGSGNLYAGEPIECRGAELKATQLATLAVPGTAMVVTDDLMKPGDDVHYPDKLTVGHRFALAALATVYGRDVAFSGPVYETKRIEGGAIRLSFSHAEGGMKTKGGARPGGFIIAGADRKWVKAEAVIDGETVVVSSPAVAAPVAVRYSWADQPSGGNLINQADLPAPVFRTDDWPMSTAGVLWEKKN